MTYTVDSLFRSAPRMTEDAFVSVLRAAGSLSSIPLWRNLAERFTTTEDAARACYRLIAGKGHDPAVWLAICAREHTYGTNRNSVLWRNDTRSWTNARSVRDPSLRRTAVEITDPVRQSRYVRYANVLDSLQDGIYRVDDPTYAYAGAVTFEEIFNVWTEDPGEYAAFVAEWMNDHAEPGGDEPVTAQIPGFEWLPADRRHHTTGRTARITGGAQHYTAGTDSRAWLTTSPNSDVSATFLVRKNATMEARGWQLVRIEDTPHTTAFTNPYTVSIEYEHMAGQPIPDGDYEVLAQTWADVTRFVTEHNLGDLNTEGVKGHKEWVNNPQLICPDGIDVARIERRRRELLASPDPKPDDGNPWFLHLGNGEHARFAYRRGFRGFVEGLAISRYPADPNSAALAIFGAPREEEWVGEDGNAYQRTDKAVLQFIPGNAQPWDIVLLARGAKLPKKRKAA